MGQERREVTPPPRPHIHSSHWKYCCFRRQLALTHHSLQVIKFATSLTIQGAGILPVQPGAVCRTALVWATANCPPQQTCPGWRNIPMDNTGKPQIPLHTNASFLKLRYEQLHAQRGDFFPPLSLNLYVLLPSPAQPENLSNLPNRRLQSPPGNLGLPPMSDKSCQSRASLMGAKWQRQQGDTGYQWIPRLTLPEYLFWKEKQTNKKNT